MYIRPSFLKAVLALGLLVVLSCRETTATESTRLWPLQTTPAGLVSIDSLSFQKDESNKKPINLSDDAFLAQSLAGLAAQAVNEGRGDELVYVDLWDNASYHTWRRDLLDRTGIEDRGYATVWDLVARYHKQEIVSGYILYSSGKAKESADVSVNVATTAAGLLRGVLISEQQEAQAKKLGLSKLLDARGKTESWCFEEFKNSLNKKQLLLQSTEIPNNRAIAIAHRALTIRGKSELVEHVYEWLQAPALVHGWNQFQEEGEAVQQLSSWGHVLCPSDWALNLPALSIGSTEVQLPHFDEVPAREIDQTSKSKRRTSFVLSDGDNLQWILGDFVWNKKYWHSPELETLPFGFGLPIADLIEVAPDAYLHLQRTKSALTSILVAPEYVFVDHLGTKRSVAEKDSLLRWYGSRIETVLKRSGLNSIILICEQLDNPHTLEAWEILAAAAPSLQAAFVMQYHPYEGGQGRVWEIGRPNSSSVPFISATHTIWSSANRPGAGTPDEIAEMINQSRSKKEVNTLVPMSGWIAVHAWSGFTELGATQDAKYHQPGTFAGVAAAAWCAKKLDAAILVDSPSELVRHMSSRSAPANQFGTSGTTSEASPQAYLQRSAQ